MRILSLFAAVVLLVAGALAQTSSAAQQNTAQQNTSSQQNSSSAGTASQTAILAVPESKSMIPAIGPEQRIAREVLHNILMEPYYSIFDDLSFQVQGSTVTLMGKVLDPTVKSDIVNEVKRIEGVEKVVDNIKVLPPLPSDDQIRRAEYRAIFGFDGLSKYSWSAAPSMHIVVDGGHVTLVGDVLNQGDKDMAGIRANSVPGVFSVDNKLQVINSNQTAKK